MPERGCYWVRRLFGRDAQPSWLKVALLKNAGVKLKRKRYLAVRGAKGRRVVAELRESLIGRGLWSLLRHGDRNSMRFSVESRVPFLTIPMVELLLSFPEEFLIADNGETKCVFRAAMRSIVPDAVLDRKDKIGFATPEENWILNIAPTVRK